MTNSFISKRYLTRLVIETQSPMAINSGNRETAFDTQLARDNNGLPYIPATAIAGVWSHVADALGIDNWEVWFGSPEKRSALTISHGVIHNSQNEPVTGIVTQTTLKQDPILARLQQNRPHHRERVAINDRGVAKDTGKFDQLLLPKGCRFTVNIQFDDQFSKKKNGQQLNEDDYQQLLNCWQSRSFAFGSSTRNGLGRIKVIASKKHIFKLEEGPEVGRALQEALYQSSVPTTQQAEFTDRSGEFLLASLPIKALDNWRCGAGTELLGNNKTEHNIITYSEPVIGWSKQQTAKISEKNQPVLCGSSIKGILAHRVAFHFRKLTQQWAENLADATNDEWEKRPDELSALFGFADAEDHNNSIAGTLMVDDCNIHFTETVIRHHNSIDRFTGGVRKGALYSEELLYQPEFTIKLWLNKKATISPLLKQALTDTLDDLKTGLLPMGAGSGRGTSLVMHKPNSLWKTHLEEIAVTEQEQAL